MIDSKARKQPKARVVVDPKDSTGKVATMPNTVPLEDRIRERAYELYQSRGREPGQDGPDWFRAEREILKRER